MRPSAACRSAHAAGTMLRFNRIWPPSWPEGCTQQTGAHAPEEDEGRGTDSLAGPRAAQSLQTPHATARLTTTIVAASADAEPPPPPRLSAARVVSDGAQSAASGHACKSMLPQKDAVQRSNVSSRAAQAEEPPAAARRS